jgi:hypothetical protein
VSRPRYRVTATIEALDGPGEVTHIHQHTENVQLTSEPEWGGRPEERYLLWTDHRYEFRAYPKDTE